VSRYEEYAGEPAAAGGIEFRVIADIQTAYNELIAGNLDVLRYTIPAELIGTAQQELGDRYFEREAAAFNYLASRPYDPRFADKRVRQAFSMAIDREAITTAIFQGARARPTTSSRRSSTVTARTPASTASTTGGRQGAARGDRLRRLAAGRPLVQRRRGHDQWVQAGGQPAASRTWHHLHPAR
jgi:ABC-type transport system substrate-binding protein